ncbi:MAG: ABC transporter permease, partial [Tistrella sp.]|nr:ABC transporter permease [Tistrella sp.]
MNRPAEFRSGSGRMRGYIFMTNFGVHAVMTAALVAAVPAMAAGDDTISDGVIKIGVLNDMSGIYADMAGRGS